MPEYKLLNPLIVGDNVNTYFKAKNIDNAAKESWNSISNYITGNVPRFGFTLQDTTNGDLHHFMVKEKNNKNETVDYAINKLNIDMNTDQENKFVNYINRLEPTINKQVGGDSSKCNNDDSPDDDDEELYEKLSLYKHKNTPIIYWWYNPLLYTMYGSNYTSIYIPTIIPTMIPYVEIDVSSAFFV